MTRASMHRAVWFLAAVTSLVPASAASGQIPSAQDQARQLPGTPNTLSQTPDEARRTEAASVELLSRDIDLHADGTYVQTSETRIRVQTPAGIQGASQMPFTFNASMQRFEVVEAYTLKADGRRLEVKRDAIFTRDLPMSTAAPLFADIKTATIVFGDVAAGDRVYARARLEQIEPMFPGHYSAVFWITPHVLVDSASIRLHAPRTVQLHIDNEGFTEVRNDAGGIRTYEWTAQQTTVEPFESGSVSPLDYSRRVSVSTFGSYAEFAQGYASRAAPKAAVTPEVQRLADTITSRVLAGDTHEQARRLYEWVVANIRYVGVFLADSAVVPHPAQQVLENRYGDCKDQVTLLTALLAAKGINAQPAIVNAADSFWMGTVPVLSNFNHVVSYLPAFDLFLDPTSRVSFGRLPPGVQGKTTVLVPSGELRRAPSDTSKDNMTVRHVTYVIGDDGAIQGTTTIEAEGAAADAYRELGRRLTPQDMPEFMRRMTTTDRYRGEGTIELDGTDTRGPMKVAARYALRGAVSWPGNESFSIPGGFAGLEPLASRVWRADAGRQYRKRVRLPGTVVEEYEIRLPEQMDVTKTPEAVAFRNELVSYEATYKRQGQLLLITRKLVDLFEDQVLPTGSIDAMARASEIIDRDLRATVVYRPAPAAPEPSRTAMATVGQAFAAAAQQLLEHRTVLDAPVKGTVKRTIRATDPTYSTPGGSSHVLMVKLPDTQEPYVLEVHSRITKGWGRTERVYVPQAVVLDERLAVTRTLSEGDIEVAASFLSGPRLQLTVPSSDPASGERFLLIYTDARSVGQRVEREFRPVASTSTSGTIGAAIGEAFLRRIRSAEGIVEVQITPAKK